MNNKPVGRIFLIGYRGAGKTTVARLVAERLDWPWHDADAFLERKLGRTIRDIFQQDGEAAFRKMEAVSLEELLTSEDQRVVLATGGGVVLRPENREKLGRAGLVIWLTADATTLWRRLQGDAATGPQRPALTDRGGLAEIEALLAAREPLYRACADLIIDTTALSPNAVAERIVAMVSGG